MYPPYTLPFAKMYINNSENLTPGVNQFPHVSSAETETHNHFCHKSAQPFDLPGFSRQKSDCFHMPRPPKQIHRPCFFRPITMLCEYFQIACQCIRTAGDVYHPFRLHKGYRVDKFFGTSASRRIHENDVGALAAGCHMRHEPSGVIAEELCIGDAVLLRILHCIPHCILI